MCGFAGIVDAAVCGDVARDLGHRMARTLVHRGPDDVGVWTGPGVVLAHRRLAVIDLSPDGHQPMASNSGDLVLAFNGEIYNYRALRSGLEAAGVGFRGASDTEVLLEAIEHWGLDEALGRSNVMFALALWDRRTRTVSLARDRLGEKPLYVADLGNRVVFGSELKALRAAGVACDVDRDALADLLGFGYVIGRHSILERVERVQPGEIVEIAVGACPSLLRRSYWRPPVGAWSTVARDELLAELEHRIAEAVRLRMVADVPVGAFLSGGIDSSLVVAVMQELSSSPVRTFTVGFDEAAFDEAPFAKAIAAHLGTEHRELYVTPRDSLDLIPRLPEIYDEPFADASQLPTYLISALARTEVAVCLSGDGGDELFGGYERYGRALDIERAMARFPVLARRAFGRALSATGPRAARYVLAPGYRVAGRQPPPPDLRHKALRLGQILRATDSREVYDGLMRHWPDPGAVLVGGGSTPRYGGSVPEVHDFTDWMMRADIEHYLPDDILVKLDRATMAVSLEGRIPLLDHELVEFALTIPSPLRRSRVGGKQLLVDLLATKVPRYLFERPKMGFGVPIDAWLRGPLRDWAEELLGARRLADEGYLRADVIRRHWDEHLTGARNWQYLLWDVLMFQAWLDRWRA